MLPVSPLGPGNPWGPVGPNGPGMPVDPSGPEGPRVPVEPAGPRPPVAPVRPVGPRPPVEPLAPVIPRGPWKPVDPVVPRGPDKPGTPCGPPGPTGPEIARLLVKVKITVIDYSDHMRMVYTVDISFCCLLLIVIFSVRLNSSKNVKFAKIFRLFLILNIPRIILKHG